ncbi:ABC transporter ATP-binding protein/permease [Tabrizicola sp. J26]|uniref:ABC transporter ATP-binding protein n=1 Tax=Alitabrizicola rongguiensis TaxID=2909234 RepID=UPI001F3B5B56|nr:ABC transporter ATP-binding protein [Tabrizicola rongguiensis]MCF1711090.1 ABC transporter ATP-binding protein/permease [Tabrizicola rongguiensis]
MLATYRKLFDLLNAHERRRFYLLLGLIILMALVDTIGVASIMPFLAVVANPEMIEKNARIAALYHWLGMTDVKQFLIVLGCLVFGMLLFSLVVKATTLIATSRFAQMRNYSISGRLLAGYLRQPYAWFLSRHSAQLSRSILSEVNTVVSGSLIPAMRIIAQAITLVFLATLLFLVNPLVAGSAILICLGSYALIFFGFRRRLLRLGQVRLAANKAKYKIAHEIFGATKDIKLLGLEERSLVRFQKPSYEIARIGSVTNVIGEMPRYLLETIAFGSILLLILILLVTGDGSLSSILPTLGVFAFAALRMFPAAQLLYYSLTGMRSGAPTLDSVHREYMQVMALGAPTAAETKGPRIHLHDRLELRDVRFSYPATDRVTLDGLSLAIEANTTVGIVGGTGAGKTTAVDIMLGLLTPQSGEVVVDGTVLTAQNMRRWQDVLGYVPQQIFLVDDSVAANIAFGEPDAKWDRAAIEQAARIANLHDFIMNDLPQGYDTHVGERGVRLSGGQRQRIGIARALYRNPDVLILDEATSALDNLTEQAVMEAVHNLRHAKTVIMIAHRLTTVKNCDVIFLLEHGRLVAQGTYEELRAGNETFRRMTGT